MEIKIVNSVDDGEWNDLLGKDGKSVFKTLELADLNEGLQYIVAFDDGRLVGGMIFSRKKVLFRNAYASDSSPIALNDGIRLSIIEFFKKIPGMKIVNTTYQDSHFTDLFLKSGFKKTDKSTVIVDLKKYSDVKQFLDKKGRWDVNKAVKEGVDVVDSTDSENDWEEFFKVYDRTGKSWGVETLEKDRFMKLKYLSRKNLVKLFLAKLNNSIVSGSIVLNSGNTAIFFINATNPDMKNIQANSLLVLEIMDYAKRNGFEYFDLFGYDPYAKKGEKTYRIDKFKLGFGGEVKHFYKFTDSNLFVLGRKLYNKIRILKKLYFLMKRL